MDTRKLLIASSVALLPIMAFAAEPAAYSSNDQTSAAVATLKSKLGKGAGLEVKDVRVTDAGVACINYTVSNDQGGMTKEHAVVQGDDVQRSTMGNTRFEKAWNDNCLGPRGGTTPAQ